MNTRLIAVQFNGPIEEPKVTIFSSEDLREGLRENIEQDILKIKFELVRMLGPFGTVSVEQRGSRGEIEFEYDETKWDGQRKYRLTKAYRQKFIAWLQQL